MQGSLPPRLWAALDGMALGFALGAIVLHDRAHLRDGRYWDVFWLCNLAAAVLVVGLALRSAALCQAALTWLLPGTAIWLADVGLTGSSILPTSWGVHLGGTLLAVYGVRRGRGRRGGVLAAAALAVAAWLGSRWTLPAHANVNAAHRVPEGWAALGATLPVFTLTTAVLAGLCLAVGWGLGRCLSSSAATPLDNR